MYCIILCGGSGTRLWPLSRKNFPKQFLKLYSDNSLLQETFLRNSGVIPKDNIFLVTNDENYFNVLHQIREVYPKFKKDRIIVEPASRSTMPAITLAVKYLKDKIKIKDNEPIIEVHSDHYIGRKKYLDVVKRAMKEVGDNIGTIGIIPTKADIGLGYIKKGEKQKGYYKVSEFKEKPDQKTAEKYVKSGKYLWNAGMYIFNTKTFSEELEKYVPEIHSLFSKKFEEFAKRFKNLPSIAIDVAISEKSKRVVVFEGDFDWSDIGSFDVLSEILNRTKKKNIKQISIDSNNVFTHSDSDRMIVTSGVDDVIVVDNNDVILVQKKGKSEDVKNVVEYLKKNNYPELEHNIIVYRPWGEYEILIESPGYKVKKITIYPKAKLSLQSHKMRSEHWVIAKGKAKITRGNEVIELKENESAFIPMKTKHRLENNTKNNLEIIEIQVGKYLKEDDIVRYEDIYNRK